MAARSSAACRYLLVDEYQDTNHSQYRLDPGSWPATHGNVCCVGDEDQSIYRFRGADIKQHPPLRARLPRHPARQAGAELPLHEGDPGGRLRRWSENNEGRIGKTLWTENGEGDAIDLYCAADDLEEASYVAERIASGSRRPSETAVLYRTNAQSRLLEEALARRAVPYMIIGGVRFYDRKEIKDILACLKLTVNPDDEVAWPRAMDCRAGDREAIQ